MFDVARDSIGEGLLKFIVWEVRSWSLSFTNLCASPCFVYFSNLMGTVTLGAGVNLH